MKKIIVIGGGAAGMFAALFARKRGANVMLLEKNDRLGKKMLISGKGRCNLTNVADHNELIAAFGKNGRFLYSAFNALDNKEVMSLFESWGVPLKTERGGRVFPISDHAADVVKALEKQLLDCGVNIKYHTEVKKILPQKNSLNQSSFQVETGNGNYTANAVIVTTGGATYPGTGSSGDGFRWAASLGHTIVPLLPSLVPLETVETWPHEIMGLALKNVEMTVFTGGKKVATEFGEMLFTHFGVSGPIVLSLSKELIPYHHQQLSLTINLKPALTSEKLDARLLRDFEKYHNKALKNALVELLPQKLIPIVIHQAQLGEDQKPNAISRQQRQQLLNVLQKLPLTIKGFRPLAEAIVTAGGVKTSEIDPRSMASKIVPDLYFAGEVIDIDALTGGYNLQAAFSTGYLAGNNA